MQQVGVAYQSPRGLGDETWRDLTGNAFNVQVWAEALQHRDPEVDIFISAESREI